MMTLLQRTLGEDIEIEARLSDEPLRAIVDPAQLESALLNLSINARDAMPSGGKLTIDVAHVHLDADAVDASEIGAGDYVVLALADTGAGMAPEVLARAFEPFFTTKEIGKGSGLGLSMVYGFMRQSRGHANIHSEVGSGTVVRLYLPAERRGEACAETASAAPSAPLRGTETILVVEDNDLVRKSVVRQLRRLGYTVIEAPGGEAAVARLREGRVDLIFTDIVMPSGMDGPELAARAETIQPGVAILFTSGYHADAIDRRGHMGPNARLLTKPYQLVDLARDLRDALEGGGAGRRNPQRSGERRSGMSE